LLIVHDEILYIEKVFSKVALNDTDYGGNAHLRAGMDKGQVRQVTIGTLDFEPLRL
jgi:hypothetical protein